MDPQLLKKFMAEGKIPNFSALAEKGSFRLLTTSIPPQSPVAWSNLITGMNAGGHGFLISSIAIPRPCNLTFRLRESSPRNAGFI